MTYREAKEIIKTAIAEVEWNYPLDYDVAFEKAIKAIGKQIPKKVISYCGAKEALACPVCGTFQDFKCKTLELRDVSDYCYKCGQKLDWSSKMTNYEKIKNMSVEEMAEFLACGIKDVCLKDVCLKVNDNDCDECEDCTACFRKWLESEVEN